MHLDDDNNSFLTQYLKNGRSMKEIYCPSKKSSRKNTYDNLNKEESFMFLKNKRKKDHDSQGLIIRIKIDDLFKEVCNPKPNNKKRKTNEKKETKKAKENKKKF